MDLVAVLDRIMPDVLEAGAMVSQEFLRADGPRGHGDKAPVDTEIEILLQSALRGVLAVPFVGEETPPVLEGDPAYCWLVDPHDGTSEFLRGARGSSVSVALLRDRIPVLGIVHAPLSPDRGSDLIAWAEGMDGLVRNGAPVRPDPAAALGPDAVVLLAFRSYARPATNLRRVAPARFISSNSIAYRLARAAAGDGVATASRQARLAAYDYAAGHALLRGAGLQFIDGAGRAPVYGADGTGAMDKCFAGAPEAVRALLDRDWSLGDPPETPLPERLALSWPRREDGLDRAIGCLAGLAIGEGSPPDGMPGQPGPVMEEALGLARALVAGRETAPTTLAAQASLAVAGRTGGWTGDEAAFLAAIDAAIGGASRRDTARAAAGCSPAFAGLLERLVGGATLDALGPGHAALGALIGAAEGRAGLPEPAFRLLLSARPLAAFGARHPRPPELWADDLPLLAEALLAARR